MKKLFQRTFFAAGILLMAASCEKVENKIYYEGGTAPELAADRTDIVLSSATKNDLAISLNWSNPNYNFTTGVSSQDVSYLLEIDTAGANFTNPNKQSISISKELSTTLTVSQLNTYLTKMTLEADVPHTLEMRVVASLHGTVPKVSNVLTFENVVPYEDFAITPPSTGQLFMIGDATPAGWGNPVPDNQQLTTVKKGLFEITIKLNAGKSYLFIPKNGSWSAKYGGTGSNNSNNTYGDAFKPEGGDLKAPPTDGTYKVVVDFKTGRFTLTKQ